MKIKFYYIRLSQGTYNGKFVMAKNYGTALDISYEAGLDMEDGYTLTDVPPSTNPFTTRQTNRNGW